MDLPPYHGRVAKHRDCQPIYQSRVPGEGSTFLSSHTPCSSIPWSMGSSTQLFTHHSLIHPFTHPPPYSTAKQPVSTNHQILIYQVLRCYECIWCYFCPLETHQRVYERPRQGQEEERSRVWLGAVLWSRAASQNSGEVTRTKLFEELMMNCKPVLNNFLFLFKLTYDRGDTRTSLDQIWIMSIKGRKHQSPRRSS